LTHLIAVFVPEGAPRPARHVALGLALAHGQVELVELEVVAVLAADVDDVAEALAGQFPDHCILIRAVNELLGGLNGHVILHQ
jgi:hypothetical protein